MTTNTCLLLRDKEKQEVTREELMQVLTENDGDLNRLIDFKGIKICWGYISKVLDYHRYHLLDMDKVIILLDDDGEAYSYEHSGNYEPEYKEGKEVIGLIDENGEIETI